MSKKVLVGIAVFAFLAVLGLVACADDEPQRADGVEVKER